MDPDKTLLRIREVINDIDTELNKNDGGDNYHICELGIVLHDHVSSLDEWLSNGGFLPHSWNKHR